MKGLFLNSKNERCSIYQSGKMIYNCLLKSKTCKFDYIEIDANNYLIPTDYDFYFFNYHHLTMSWLDVKKLKQDFGFVMTVVLEVLPNDPFPYVDANAFDIYCAIDPTMNIDNPKVFSFPRPLDFFESPKEKIQYERPIIGSFGLPTPGKGYTKLIEAVNKEFDEALVRINLPGGDFVENFKIIADMYENDCKSIANQGIKVQVTRDFMDKEELIKWCSNNTINCFFYDRNQPGLAATTDQAISSGAPLLVSDNETFRHITQYIKPYPECSIKEAIETTGPIVEQIKKDWTQEVFTSKFDDMIQLIESEIKSAEKVKKKKVKIKKISSQIGPTDFYLFGFIPALKIKRWSHKEKIYLFGLPIFKIKRHNNENKYYLFSFLYIFKT